MSATAATDRRVAVVVVPGVGDDAPGETLDAVAAALVSRIELQDGERRELMLSPAGNEVGYRSPWTRLHSPDRALEVDVYEMRWADISRFPGGVLRLVYTLYALLLQISTLGLEALRPLRGFMRRARVARDALMAAAWLLAIPVLAVTAAVVLESGAVLGAVAFDGSPILARVVAVTVALVSVGFAAWGAHRLRRGGWQGLPPAVAVLVALLLIADAAWWVSRDGLRVGLANALVWVVAYPFRIAWLAASGAAAAAAVAVALTAFRRDGGFLRLGPERRRASLTGLITLAVAPLGVALVSATLFAAYGALALQVADDSSWGGTSELQCLATPSSWSLTPCDEVVLEPSEAQDLGLPAGATVAEGSPADWAFALFSRGLGPLAPALLVAGILLGLLILVAVVPFLLAIGASRIEARRDRRAASERQGALMSSALDVAGNSLTGLLALAAVLAGAAAVYATWLAAGAPGSTTAARLGGAIALVVSALVILVRFLGVSPRRPLGSNASALERLRIVLDIPYDVATYLRVSQPGLVAPRERMLRRYRALLGEVAAGGVDRRRYDALVIVSHSQGTVLSAATLFGDLHRSPPARPLDDEEPDMVLPPRVSLLTCGCPLRQLYGERFPGQYDWVGELPLRPGGLRPVTGTWVNLYRSGDYVGRALWTRDPDAPGVYDPEREGYDLRAPGNPRVVERCVGAGSHTGYWSDATLGDWVMRLVLEG